MVKQLQVVIDCGDPATLSTFWAEATGYVLQPPPEGFESWEAFLRDRNVPEGAWNDASAIVDPDGKGPRLYFQRVPEGKTVKNRVHLDINQASSGTPADQRRALVEAEARRLQDLGATIIGPHDDEHEFWIVMQDPEGNEFCLQ